jgi:uncharacterized phage infection (PIP) family protein YhgE
LKSTAASFWLSVSAFAFVSCTAPRPEPFKSYRDSVVNLRSAAENAIDQDAAAARNKFIERAIASDRPGAYASERLRVNLDDSADPFVYGPPAQLELFLQSAAASQALKELNGAFERHADLLFQLASEKTLSVADIDKATNDINASARDAIKELNTALAAHGKPEITPPNNAIALVSAGTAELLHQFLVHRQAKYLSEAVRAAQPAVSAYAKNVLVLLEVLALAERQQYDRRMLAIAKGLADADTSTKKRDWIEQMIAAHERVTGSLDTLKSLRRSYAQIPKALANLEDAAGGVAASMQDIQDLATEVQLVAKRYNALRKANANTN